MDETELPEPEPVVVEEPTPGEAPVVPQDDHRPAPEGIPYNPGSAESDLP